MVDSLIQPKMNYLFTAISRNQKTGPIPVTTSSKVTCPDSCPLKRGPCYAMAGALNIHWSRLTAGASGMSWDGLLSAIRKLRRGTLWRHNQAGDLPAREGDLTGNSIDRSKLRELTRANSGKLAICYSHKPVLDSQSPEAKANRVSIAEAIAGGFTINLSANNLTHADALLKLGIAPVVAIVPTEQVTNCKTPGGARAIICPASVREGVTCSTCGLCARAKREYVICFPSHGTSTRAVNALAMGAVVG